MKMHPVAMATTLLMASFLAGGGCAGYRVGSMLPDDVTSVYVATVENRSNEPLLESDVTRALLRQLQQDGSLRIATENEADAILTVVLTDYQLEAVTYRADVRTAASQYRANITASMVMRRTADQSVVAEAPRIVGHAVFDVTGDLSSSKLTGNPNAAADLSDRIVQRIVEYW